jgi:hypothetical protein
MDLKDKIVFLSTSNDLEIDIYLFNIGMTLSKTYQPAPIILLHII